MMENNKEAKILKKLKESGFPVEIDVTEILEKEGWKVANQVGYLDPDENKWRLIDIRAVRAEEISNSSTYKRLVMHLHIECKKSKNPWVFYIRRKEKMPFFPFELLHVLKEASWPPVLLKSFLKEKANWKECFHYLKYEHLGVISVEPPIEIFNESSEKKKKGKEKLFEATQQVIKSLKYELEKTKDELPLVVKSPIFVLKYPVIVLDGKLYVLRSKEGPIESANYVQFLVEYKEESFLIDIVLLSFLKEYLKILNEEFIAIKENINLLQPSSLSREYT